jgi:hypothetical protein
MSFTYILTTDLGKVRFLVPDNDSTSFDLQDDEVQYFLTTYGTVKAAAVAACQWLARKYAKQATFSADGLSYQAGQRAQAYADRAKELSTATQGGIVSTSLTKEDGYSEAVTTTEYQERMRIIYIETE